MADMGEIKAKVSIEYDGSGLEEAKKDLQSFGEMAQGAGEGAGQLGDSISQMGTQLIEGAKGAESLGHEIGAIEAPMQASGVTISEVSDRLGEHQQAIEEAGSAYEALQSPIEGTVTLLEEASRPMERIAEHAQSLQENLPAVGESFAQIQEAVSQAPLMLPQYAESLRGISETFSSGHLAENMAVFEDALVNPEPFSMIGQYLKETGQNWSDFTGSIGQENVSILHDMATYGQSIHEYLGGVSQDVAQTGQVMAGTQEEADAFTRQFNGLNEVHQQAKEGSYSGLFPSIDEGIIGTEAAGSSLLGGLGNFFMGMQNIAFPLMAFQQVGMMAVQMGKQIYAAAAIAEGPAAHSLGTFTGTVDTLTFSFKQAGEQFSESFGQQMMPTLNAMNDVISRGGGGTSNYLGTLLGGATSFVSNLGLAALSIPVAATLVGIPLAQKMFVTGEEGLANQFSSWMGGSTLFSGPQVTASQQVQQSYQAQMANLQPQVVGDTAKLMFSTDTILAESMNPQYLQAQDMQTAAQAFMARTQANYNAGHPISQQQLRQQAMYDAYLSGFAPQNQWGTDTANYDAGTSFFSVQQPSNWERLMGTPFGGLWSFLTPTQQVMMPGSLPSNPISDAGAAAGQWSADATKAAIKGIGSLLGGLTDGWQSLGSTSPSTIGTMMSGLGNFMQGLTQGWQGLGSNSGSTIGTLFGSMSNFFGNLLGGSPTGTSGDFGGCFPTGTHVLLADGTQKAIERLEVGDIVLGHDGRQQVATPILALLRPPARMVYALRCADGRVLHTTNSHPIATLRGWAAISPEAAREENPDLDIHHLLPFDSLITSEGKTVRLLSIVPTKQEQIFNITVGEPHTFYAAGILVHNKEGFVSGTGGQMTAEHTFQAKVTWVAEGLEHTFQGVASWIGQGLQNTFNAIATWVGQGLENTFQGVASWVGQNLEHGFQAVANWVGQNLEHGFEAVASWVGQNLEKTFTGVASWVGQNLEHTFVGVATWIQQTISTVGSSLGIPGFASGIENFSGGYAVVGENGPELVHLPGGSSVTPTSQLNALSSLGTAGQASTGPQSANIAVYLDSQMLTQVLGVSLANSIRVGMGQRSF